jgi:transcriptional regulator with XRE-family HTH domain
VTRYLAATTKDFGQLIRGFRKQRAWTQARLAERAGLLPKTISAIEAGAGQVLLANVMRALSALDVDLSLDSRPENRTTPDPTPTVVRPPATVVPVRPKAFKPRRASGDETVTSSPPPAKQATKRARPSPASRATSAAKALKEKW